MSYSSFENNSDNSFFQTSSNILDYLIRKLEARSKSINKYVASLTNDDSNLLAVSFKNEIVSLLKDLEVDLNQAASAIKALLTENKMLFMKKYLITDCSSINNTNGNVGHIIETLTKENTKLKNENESLQFQVQQQLTTQQWQITKEDEDILNDNDNTVSLLHKQLTNVTEENDHVNIIDTHNNNNNNKLLKAKNKNVNFPNMNNIIEHLKDNKNKLKIAIKQHFNHNNINNNNNNNNVKTKSKDNVIPTTIKGQIQYKSKTQQFKNKHERKISSYVNDIIIRIINTPNAYVILNKQLGSDFIMKLANANCSEEYITQVITILNDIEDDNNNNNIQFKTPIRIEHNYKSPQHKPPLPQKTSLSLTTKSPINNNNNSKRSLSSTINPRSNYNTIKHVQQHQQQQQTSSITSEKSFENNLRNYSSSLNKTKNKIFNNYTNPYGNYFNKH